MLIFYLDASADREKFILSAIRISSECWREAFEETKEFRHRLRDDYGIYVKKELHATDLVGGRREYAPEPITKYQRSQVFRETLEFIVTLPSVEILNVSIRVPGCPVDPYIRAFERMVNRIQAHLEDNRAEGLIIVDEGKEGMIRKLSRQLAVFNWIPSKFGGWANGQNRKNIRASRIIEDPIFKTSESSYFIQFADAVAFSLLKKEVKQTPRIAKYRIHEMFEILTPRLCLQVSPDDPLGIERG